MLLAVNHHPPSLFAIIAFVQRLLFIISYSTYDLWKAEYLWTRTAVDMEVIDFVSRLVCQADAKRGPMTAKPEAVVRRDPSKK